MMKHMPVEPTGMDNHPLDLRAGAVVLGEILWEIMPQDRAQLETALSEYVTAKKTLIKAIRSGMDGR